MPFMQILLTGISTREWADKQTGEQKSLTFLTGRVGTKEEFIVDDEMARRYKPLIGHEILLPYVERGKYRNIDMDVHPIPVQSE